VFVDVFVTRSDANHVARESLRCCSRILVSPEGIDSGKARPEAETVLLMNSERDRSEWNEEW
jgi:hypothetical protein